MIARRRPLPTTMYFRRSTARRGGRSARTLLVAAWRRAFGGKPDVFIASTTAPRADRAA